MPNATSFTDSYIKLGHMLSPARLSVRLSVTRVDHTKTVEDRIMKFSLYGSPILPLVLRGLSFDHPEIRTVSP